MWVLLFIWNTFITCHFSIWIFESFISGSHSSLYPFSFLLWLAWGPYDGICLLSSSSAHSGQALRAGRGWGRLSPAGVGCDRRSLQSEDRGPVLLAFLRPAPASFLPHPLPSSSFFTSTVIQYFSLHFFSGFGRTVWLAWLVQGMNPGPWQWKPRVLTTEPPGNSSVLNIFFFSLQLLIFEMCSTHLTLWCQTTVTIVRFCYCMFPLMISGETVSIFSVSDRTRTMFVSAQNKVQSMWTLLKSRRPVWGSVAQCLSCVVWVVDFVFWECLLSFLELWPSSCLVGYHSRASLDNSNMQHFYVLNFGIGEYTWKAHYFTFQCVEKSRLLMSA